MVFDFRVDVGKHINEKSIAGIALRLMDFVFGIEDWLQYFQYL